MRAVIRFFMTASMVASSLGCSEPNTLSGSISQSHDLSFDAVQLQLLSQQQAYELKYTKALDSGDDDVVAKVVFDRPAAGVTAEEELDLLALGGIVERVTAANDTFPAGLERANVTFTSGGNDADEATTGSFASTFDNGKTLNGTFEVELAVVDF